MPNEALAVPVRFNLFNKGCAQWWPVLIAILFWSRIKPISTGLILSILKDKIAPFDLECPIILTLLNNKFIVYIYIYRSRENNSMQTYVHLSSFTNLKWLTVLFHAERVIRTNAANAHTNLKFTPLKIYLNLCTLLASTNFKQVI